MSRSTPAPAAPSGCSAACGYSTLILLLRRSVKIVSCHLPSLGQAELLAMTGKAERRPPGQVREELSSDQ
jgi:hypothetical protein